MICKMHQLINFPSFFEKIKNKPLSIKVSYHLTILASEIEKHVNFYFKTIRELMYEYGQRDKNGNLIQTDDGQGIKIIEDKMDECNAKIIELRDLDVELPNTKFSIDDFGDIALTPMEVYIIKPFIAE